MMNILVAIPSICNPGMLGNLLHSLKSQKIRRVVVYDNGYTSDEGLALLAEHDDVIDARDWPFYKMWNDAWRLSHEDSYDAVALLNDDIVLHEKSLEVAFDVLCSDKSIGVCGLNYKRAVNDGVHRSLGFEDRRGTYKDGGVWGCAFLVNSATWGKVPPIDERYNLWYGDDELFLNMGNYGFRVGIALGSPVFHYASVTTEMMPQKLARISEDEKLFSSKFL